MIQWILRKLIFLTGVVYVILDSFAKHENTDEILGIKIDDEFQTMTRKQLCSYIELRFGIPQDSFWSLQSTQKIRLCCEILRKNKIGGK